MSSIRMESVTKQFGAGRQYCNVYDLDFEAKDGELFCFVGPTNSGKTTILRLIAGLDKPDRGHVFIDGMKVNEVQPSRRQIAMLFEELALYPNKNGYGNLASPLKIKKLPKEEIKKLVMGVSKLLGIEHLLYRTPETYSGGERQRVALGRVLVSQAKAYLLDEPLGGLDARLRISMRSELKKLQRELGQTMVMVSHDQEEVMSLGNRISVLEKGRIHQVGTPAELYNKPIDSYVARTIGKPEINLYECILKQKNGKVFLTHAHFTLEIDDRLREAGDQSREQQLILGIRPEHIEIVEAKQTNDDIPATIFISETLGVKTIVDLRIGEETIRTVTSSDSQFQINESRWLRFRKDRIHLFEKKSGKAIL